MIVLAYYNSSTGKVLRFTVLQEAPSQLPANTAAIQIANVPADFFESYDVFKVSAGALVKVSNPSYRITSIALQPSTLQAKINAVPYARQKIAKTTIFSYL